jgi:hypothetical protein
VAAIQAKRMTRMCVPPGTAWTGPAAKRR